MLATGVGFFSATQFWPLLVIAFVGTLNPSAGDVTLFPPTEQAVLAEAAAPRHRTGLFAWYNLAGAVAGAVGSLASGAAGAPGPSAKMGARVARALRVLFCPGPPAAPGAAHTAR